MTHPRKYRSDVAALVAAGRWWPVPPAFTISGGSSDPAVPSAPSASGINSDTSL